MSQVENSGVTVRVAPVDGTVIHGLVLAGQVTAEVLLAVRLTVDLVHRRTTVPTLR